MISRVHGTLLVRDLDRIEVLTAGGTGYEISIPLTVFERLPRAGKPVELLTYQVVREDAVMLFGFLDAAEKTVFARLLGTQGVGPRLAIAVLSSLPPARLARAVRERDVAALTTVSGVGKKTAERLVLDLSGKLDDIPLMSGGLAAGPGVDEAVRALSVLGFLPADAERAVRAAIKQNDQAGAQELIRIALTHLK